MEDEIIIASGELLKYFLYDEYNLPLGINFALEIECVSKPNNKRGIVLGNRSIIPDSIEIVWLGASEHITAPYKGKVIWLENSSVYLEYEGIHTYLFMVKDVKPGREAALEFKFLPIEIAGGSGRVKLKT